VGELASLVYLEMAQMSWKGSAREEFVRAAAWAECDPVAGLVEYGWVEGPGDLGAKRYYGRHVVV
jgi:hypothetical protein